MTVRASDFESNVNPACIIIIMDRQRIAGLPYIPSFHLENQAIIAASSSNFATSSTFESISQSEDSWTITNARAICSNNKAPALPLELEVRALALFRGADIRLKLYPNLHAAQKHLTLLLHFGRQLFRFSSLRRIPFLPRAMYGKRVFQEFFLLHNKPIIVS